MAQLPSQSQFGDYGEWPGRDVLDSDGERLGSVREIYLDRETGHPEWVLVDIDGGEARFVPLADAEVVDTRIRVAHAAATIGSAPGIGTEPRIDQSEERRLYDHYGIGYSTEESPSGLPADEPAPEPPSSSWSDAGTTEERAAVAPAPAEPPSPSEIERAETAEPEVLSPSAAGPSAEPDAQAAPEPDPSPASEPLISPSATSEPPEVFTPAESEAPTPQPEAPKAPPSSASPPEPEPASKLDVVKNRKAGVAAGVSIAAVLFLIIRRLR